MQMWCIQGTVRTYKGGGYWASRQIPTFYLDPEVQGILSAEVAKQVAYDILGVSAPERVPVLWRKEAHLSATLVVLEEVHGLFREGL